MCVHIHTTQGCASSAAASVTRRSIIPGKLNVNVRRRQQNRAWRSRFCSLVPRRLCFCCSVRLGSLRGNSRRRRSLFCTRQPLFPAFWSALSLSPLKSQPRSRSTRFARPLAFLCRRMPPPSPPSPSPLFDSPHRDR